CWITPSASTRTGTASRYTIGSRLRIASNSSLSNQPSPVSIAVSLTLLFYRAERGEREPAARNWWDRAPSLRRRSTGGAAARGQHCAAPPHELVGLGGYGAAGLG